jgi:hypothetical protein
MVYSNVPHAEIQNNTDNLTDKQPKGMGVRRETEWFLLALSLHYNKN